MKVLILSFYFAPYNTMAAHRLTTLSRYLVEGGHDVRVVTAHHPSLPKDIASDMAKDGIVRTRFFDIDVLSRAVSFLRRLIGNGRGARGGNPGPADTAVDATVHPDPGQPGTRLQSSIDRLYRNLLFWPDAQVGWLVSGLPATIGLCRRWQPDLIYATSPPPTLLLLGWLVSRRLSVPWIAEIRDRWADDPYDDRSRWRVFLDRKLESRVLSSAGGIVTVSETWAQFYRERYGRPTVVIYNGYSPEDYRARSSAGDTDRHILRIVYTGALYAGRDPGPLWEALRLMGDEAAQIRVEFCGTPSADVLPGVQHHGVEDHVFVQPYLSHEAAVRMQNEADVLLLLQWNNSSEEGNLPGKLFEYLGARRPILALGYAEGEMAHIIRDRSVGLVSTNPREIAEQLKAWRDTKGREGQIPALPETVRAGFSRDEQFGKMNALMDRVRQDAAHS